MNADISSFAFHATPRTGSEHLQINKAGELHAEIRMEITFMNDVEVGRAKKLQAELDLITRWESLPSAKDDPIGREAREMRRKEILEQLQMLNHKSN